MVLILKDSKEDFLQLSEYQIVGKIFFIMLDGTISTQLADYQSYDKD